MFDVLTYEKGASVLRMLEQYLGADKFRDGIRLSSPPRVRQCRNDGSLGRVGRFYRRARACAHGFVRFFRRAIR